ncbi:response regulator [Halorubrum salinum]|mgnify:CR=1 FL=1|uniref:response regulator n=1 Tax=Halorubrum salinum TaxID=767517 RepID=UPI002111FF4B|nr:response regulator [Halorubrum salinum]
MTELSQTPEREPPTILVVEDERGLADLFALYLEDEYTTRVAYGGEEALDLIDGDVDAVLLDRRMPGLSGDETLATLRERGHDQPISMLTAVDPEEDIIGLDIDEYLIKPISEVQLQEAAEALLARRRYDKEFREYFAAISKKAALDASMSEQERASSDAYNTLEEEVTEATDTADSTLTEMMATDAFAGSRFADISDQHL